MLDLILDVCLRDDPQTCVRRLLPGPCAAAEAEARADEWAAARGLVVRSAACGAGTPLPVEEVAPGVFVHKGPHALASPETLGDGANIGFIVGQEAVAVIDAGGSRAVGEGLYAAVREQTDLPIRWLVLTHMHPDHTLGASVFAEAGAEVIGHENLRAALDARAETYLDALLREAGAHAFIGTEVVLPEADVAEVQALDLGGRVVRLNAHATAHTDNDLSALDEETGTLWAGDLVFHEHLPTLDGSLKGWLEVLDGIEGWEVARVVPGHGGPVLPWPEGGDPMRGYLEALLQETRAAVARGDSLTDAVPSVGSNLQGDWELFDVFHRRNVTAAFRELEWE